MVLVWRRARIDDHSNKLILMFRRERERFGRFRTRLPRSGLVKREMEQAIATVYWGYDTRLRENRFIVGGVIEYVVGAALRACGVAVRHKGIITSDIDLPFEDASGGYSCKAILKGSGTRLVNTMGAAAGPERWNCATLFVVSGVGIVYADPELDWWRENRSRCIRVASDAITVTRRCVTEFADTHPEWVLECAIPLESDRERRSHPARTASADLAAQILLGYPRLLQELANLRPGEATFES